MSSVGIIGGGPGGLAVAHDLARAGHDITLFEAASDFGGLARSLELGGIRIERYYHFICADDAGYFRKLRELGIEHKLRWKPTRMGFFYQGTSYPFSSSLDLLRFGAISLEGRLRYGLSVLYCWQMDRWEHLDGVSAETWLVRMLGHETYRATWYPLLKVKFGQYHNEISAAWAWHRVHRIVRSRRTPLHPEVLGYIQGGTDALIAALVAELQQRNALLLPGMRVERIDVSGKRAVGIVTADGVERHFDHVVSTVPLPLLLGMIPNLPAPYREQLSRIEYIGVICLVFRLRHSLTESYWLNINDDHVPFNGCIEYTNLNEQATPDGSKIVYVPYYLPQSHEWFGYTDEQLVQECVAALRVINPRFSSDWIIGCAVSRDPFAQVICRTGFREQIPAHSTPVQNLYLMDSSQLYPSDRTMSGTFDRAQNVASLIVGATDTLWSG